MIYYFRPMGINSACDRVKYRNSGRLPFPTRGLCGFHKAGRSELRYVPCPMCFLSSLSAVWETSRLQIVGRQVDGWSGAFSIQRLEGSQFGNWRLWILDKDLCG